MQDTSKTASMTEKAPDRIRVLEKISEYERLGLFDRDVEDDPPTRPLRPGEVDYTEKKLSTRIAMRIANRRARAFFEARIADGSLVIKAVEGLDNFAAVKDAGAVITCNHFNAFDNYAVYKALEPAYGGPWRLYKVIREGNYTSFPGLYGYFFRHCNTLPLGSSISVLREMMAGVQALLLRGEKILIYPEQGMWWNYRKPRPLKTGAFRFAVKAGVPVLPVFITTEETERSGSDGFPILAYTVHILPAVYPDPAVSAGENVRAMAQANYDAWKRVYESVYGIPLSYTTENAGPEGIPGVSR